MIKQEWLSRFNAEQPLLYYFSFFRLYKQLNGVNL